MKEGQHVLWWNWVGANFQFNLVNTTCRVQGYTEWTHGCLFHNPHILWVCWTTCLQVDINATCPALGPKRTGVHRYILRVDNVSIKVVKKDSKKAYIFSHWSEPNEEYLEIGLHLKMRDQFISCNVSLVRLRGVSGLIMRKSNPQIGSSISTQCRIILPRPPQPKKVRTVWLNYKVTTAGS